MSALASVFAVDYLLWLTKRLRQFYRKNKNGCADAAGGGNYRRIDCIDNALADANIRYCK